MAVTCSLLMVSLRSKLASNLYDWYTLMSSVSVAMINAKVCSNPTVGFSKYSNDAGSLAQ